MAAPGVTDFGTLSQWGGIEGTFGDGAADTVLDLYRIAGVLLAAPGVERTSVGISMYEMVPYRISPLLERAITK